MPDWSYRTLFQPLLLRLPVAIARSIALGGIGTLAKLPGGKFIIDFMGHMQPDVALSLDKGGLKFPSRVGLGHLIDPTGNALAAMSRFGFGCIEVGPLDVTVAKNEHHSIYNIKQKSFFAGVGLWAVSLPSLKTSFAQRRTTTPPVLLRIPLDRMGSKANRESEWVKAIEVMAAAADGIIIDAGRGDFVDWLPLIKEVARGKSLVWRHCSDYGYGLPPEVTSAVRAGCLDGIFADEVIGRRHLDSKCRPEPLLGFVRQIRSQIGPDVLLMTRGGVIEPQDALDFYDAGADVVLIDEGLVFSGPGLSKRINEACLSRIPIPSRLPSDTRQGPDSWVWTLLLGAALFGGGFLAFVIAVTRVILPYDESFVGMNREQLCGVNPKLVDFMSHDRVTLSGTMMSLGLCYLMLSYFGVKRGRHWAKVTIQASCFVGFASFFAFLGYGYFDPFHAFVASILFQFQLFGLAAPLSAGYDRVTPTLREDRSWRLSQWGQLILICHAVALFVAGVVIVGIGSTTVFVSEDLEFMNTTANALSSANPRIVPLVAHDRASFGGMLLSCGLATLLPVLWGFERGRPWLWWMLAGAGMFGYLCAIGIHIAVGYTDSWHLAPAIGGLLVLTIGLVCSRSFLWDVSPEES